jgi:WD40 repeat protein
MPPPKDWALPTCLALLLTVPSWAHAAAPPQPGRKDRAGDPLPAGALARLGTVRLRHSDEVISVAFAPDGKALASASKDWTISLWEPNTGKEIRRWRQEAMDGMEGPAEALAWSADGTQLVGVGGGGIRRWDVKGRLLLSVAIRGPTNFLTLSPDGRLVANLPDVDQRVRLWDTTTGKEVRSGPRLKHLRGAFSPDGKVLALGGWPGQKARLWDVAAGKVVRSFGRFGGSTSALAFSPDGKLIAEALEGRRALVFWEADTGKERRRLLEAVPGISQLVFSPDGRWLAGARGGQVLVWDLRAGKLHCAFGGDLAAVHDLAFSPDSKCLAAGCSWPAVRLWDVTTGKDLHPPPAHVGAIRELAFSPDGKTVASAGGEREAKAMHGGDGEPMVALWDASTGQLLRRWREEVGLVAGLAFAADGKTLTVVNERLFAGKANRHLYVVCSWSVASGKERGRFQVLGEENARTITALSADARLLAFVGPEDGAIELWDVASGKKQRTIPGPRSPLVAAFSPDGRGLAILTGRERGLWDLTTGKPVWAHRVDHFIRRQRHSFACAPGGKLFATANLTWVDLWDSASGKRAGKLSDLWSGPPLAFSPDGKTLVSCASGGAVELWDVRTGKRRRVLRGHRGPVEALAFSRDGRRLATGGRDTTVLIWDVAEGRET